MASESIDEGLIRALVVGEDDQFLATQFLNHFLDHVVASRLQRRVLREVVPLHDDLADRVVRGVGLHGVNLAAIRQQEQSFVDQLLVERHVFLVQFVIDLSDYTSRQVRQHIIFGLSIRVGQEVFTQQVKVHELGRVSKKVPSLDVDALKLSQVTVYARCHGLDIRVRVERLVERGSRQELNRPPVRVVAHLLVIARAHVLDALRFIDEHMNVPVRGLLDDAFVVPLENLDRHQDKEVVEVHLLALGRRALIGKDVERTSVLVRDLFQPPLPLCNKNRRQDDEYRINIEKRMVEGAMR